MKPAPFQSHAQSGDVARVEPNKKWFGKGASVYYSSSVIAHQQVTLM